MLLLRRNMDKLKKAIEDALKPDGIQLYELKWLSNEHTLQVSIMKADGSMDLDTCAEVSEKISAVLDEEDPFTGEYTLEVCSPGAEREIKDLSELEHMQGSYVYMRLKEPVKKKIEFTGEIISVEDGVITLSYRDKAATRKAETAVSNIEFIRMAVRI